MFKRIGQHMKDVERAIIGMPANGAYAFGLACTERQWPIFQRALEGSSSMQSAGSSLRCALDVAWKHVKNATIPPVGLAAGCRHEVAQADDLMDAIARTIANSIVDLLDAIEKQNTGYARRLSYRNFDLLDLLLDEHGVLLNDLKEDSGHEASEIAGVRELIEQEIQQQNRDVQSISSDSSAAGIEKLRQSCTGRSLFLRESLDHRRQ